MAKAFAKKFYNSKAWLRCRAAFIAERVLIDGGMCQHCGNKVGYIVDHIKELTPENIGRPEVSLNHENFQYLCTQCHNIKTNKKETMRRSGFAFDENGQIAPLSELKS